MKHHYSRLGTMVPTHEPEQVILNGYLRTDDKRGQHFTDFSPAGILALNSAFPQLRSLHTDPNLE